VRERESYRGIKLKIKFLKAKRAQLSSLLSPQLYGERQRHGARFAGRAIKIRDNTAELLETTSQRPFKEV
jgi:hypothetical protein